MIFEITRASRSNSDQRPTPSAKPIDVNGSLHWQVDIYTIEDLMSLVNEAGDELIIGRDRRILIYDNYIER
jgi:hypothetical protein